MTSFIEMSLEDIIQKKKREIRNKSKIKKPLPAPKQNHKIIDARNKIISKKRTQIRDAREKLTQLGKLKDARLKLQQLREKRLKTTKIKEGKIYNGREMFVRTLHRKDRVFVDPSRQVTSQSHFWNKDLLRHQTRNNSNNRFTDGRIFGSRSIMDTSALKPILRTVENDIEIIDDPMDVEHIPNRSSFTKSNRKASLQLKIIAHNNDTHAIRNGPVQRHTITETELSPPRPTSILKKRPIATLRNERKEEKTEKPVLEYRIIVSNLRNTVTGGDIEELFGDVGGMQESRLVRPGTAEVLYKTLEDAQRAVDLYHNRQLDGQPMNCLLVTPRSASTVSRANTKSALYSTNSNVEPDISTFHKVLFGNL
ncbi:polymerase delta-interacting protein 3-like [Battus philenor]|uniref:polymerase delta-interacting protein 3-like n=1 Tax=Battus philenor TaxID=42288 RepID=UPI0035CFA5C8